MTTYFYHSKGTKMGPFTMEDLKNQPISNETPVWRQGLPDWVKAKELSELNDILAPTPPPFQRNRSFHKVVTFTTRFIGFALLVYVVLFILGRIFGHTGSSTSNSSVFTYVDQEKTNPSLYLRTAGTYQPNFWGTKWNINGTISSFATHTNYKDLTLQVNFYSATNTIIDKKYFTLYDYYPYGLKKNFNLTVDKPAAAAALGWQVLGAKPY